MTEKQLKYLYDIRLAINEIEDFGMVKGGGFQIFNSDVMYRKAVERNLEIIWEGVNRLLKSDFEKSITHARSIIALQNKISHEYDHISSENIWSIVIRHLPLLKEEVEQLIAGSESE